MISILLAVTLTWAQSGSPANLALTCFQHELDLWEATRGRLPSADEADLIVDMCMEKYDAKVKNQEKEAQQEKAKP